MIFLPIVARELLVASRRRGTYWLRVTAAAAALVFCGISLVTLAMMPSFTAAGERLFWFLGWFGLIFALLVGVQATADCLSREKREGTLGLLFLTDLRGFDVVCGKLAAAALTVLYAIVAMLPVLALPLLIGGVTATEYARMALVWLNSLFFAVTAGVAVSAMCRDERVALGNAFALVLALTLGLPLTGMIIDEWRGVFYFTAPCAVVSLITACHLAFETSFAPNARGYWVSLGVTHGLAWLFLWTACHFAGTTWRDKTAKPRRAKQPQALALDGADPRNVVRRRALERNPLLWLFTRECRVRWYPWILLVTMGVVWGWGYRVSRGVLELQTTLTFAYLTHCLLKWWVATVACRYFAEERENRSLELLLSTPLRVATMLRGTAQAHRWLFGWPTFTVIALEMAMIPIGLNRDYNFHNSRELILMLVANAGIFLLDSWALRWAGLLAGFKSRQPQTAVWRTILTVLVLPWVAVWGVAGLGALGGGRIEEMLLVGTWVVFSIATDLFFGLRARLKLHRHLRTLALSSGAEGRAG